jgi:hypothetical protein
MQVNFTMSKTTQIIDKFATLIDVYIPHLETIVWDLDGTLGKLPGWAGTNLTDYIGFDIKALLSFLSKQYGIKNVLVSRNGVFCDNDFYDAVPLFQKLGFNVVEQCFRKQPQRSKTDPFEQKDTVMLIDDQWYECERALDEGCHAMHLQQHIGLGFLNNRFIVYVQE